MSIAGSSSFSTAAEGGFFSSVSSRCINVLMDSDCDSRRCFNWLFSSFNF